MAKPPIPDESWRCRVVRFMKVGDEQGCQTRFAKQILELEDIKSWNNVERGHPLSKQMAILLVRKIQGLTTDYLWFGSFRGVPGMLQDELVAAEKGLISAEGTGRKRR